MNAANPQQTGVPRQGFAADILPGLTTAAVVVPKALAYATIAQLPVQAGLFAAMVPMVVYAVLGTSRVLSVSTTTPIAILCASAIGEALRADPTLSPLTAAATLSAARRRDARSRRASRGWGSWPTSSRSPCSRGSRRAWGS